ncbi:CPBP family intramembrane glutamic endopeptidase (plasmid) [Haloarcula sp. NS06]|uniref:CPBP family intramembrane glutamic endopeptidase n=1 Tax=Haloarcula sp. NS06 TaxID=3409688 RepID=UPI003DA6EB71
MSTTQSTRKNRGTVSSRLGVAVIITVTVWIYLEFVAILLGHSPRAGPLLLGEFPVVRDVSAQLLRGFLAVGLTLLAVRVFDISSPLEWMGVRRPRKWEWAYILLGVVLAFVWLVGSLVLIQNVLGLERTMLLTLPERVRIARVVTLLVLVGPAEEVIFHGIIQRSLEDVIGLWPAIAAGGILFGMSHADPAALALGDLLFYIAQGGFGMIAGWIYAKTDNIVVPALVHGIFVSLTTALPLLAG